MNQKEIELKLLEKNFRIFKEKTQPLLIKNKRTKADNDNILMEGYVVESYSGKDFGDKIDEYWPGILGDDEQGIDFLYINEEVLYVFNVKNGNGNYKHKDLEEILKGIKTCYGESTTRNKILNDFIGKFNPSKIKKIEVYYFCREGDKKITEPKVLRAKSQIELYSTPKKTTGGNFIGIEVFFLNYEDVYLNDKKIFISINRDDEYLFSVNQETIYIARVPCKSIKEVVKKYGKDIFEKNIREEVGGKINSEIQASLLVEPEDIFILNNGITIVGDIINDDKRNKKINVFNAQIINGQQSSWTISSIDNLSDKAYILCRFIQMDSPEKVRKITKTTNSQNPIDFRDFCSNDEIQEAIGEYFFQKNIFYERKASNKKIKGFPQKITNVDLAQSTLAVLLGYPSKITTPKREVLFTDNLDGKGRKKGFYTEIFLNQKIEDMEDVYNKYYLKSKEESKNSKKELVVKGWLHIARIWYVKKCKNFKDACKLFDTFTSSYGIKAELKKDPKKNPLSRKETDINLDKFLETKK